MLLVCDIADMVTRGAGVLVAIATIITFIWLVLEFIEKE